MSLRPAEEPFVRANLISIKTLQDLLGCDVGVIANVAALILQVVLIRKGICTPQELTEIADDIQAEFRLVRAAVGGSN